MKTEKIENEFTLMNNLISLAKSSDIVIVDNTTIDREYFVEVDLLLDEDDKLDGIYFGGECIIDSSNLNDVIQIDSGRYQLKLLGDDYIIFTFASYNIL